MANDDHVAQLMKGVANWNAWRDANPDIRPDLGEANLSKKNLSKTNLRRARLLRTNLEYANLSGADLTDAWVFLASLWGADLSHAILNGAMFSGANLSRANLTDAGLNNASLDQAILTKANFTRADLTGSYLEHATLVDTNFTDANLTGCRVYGVSAWSLTLDGAKQQNLVIQKKHDPPEFDLDNPDSWVTTQEDEPAITVDSIEVAQFVYLMFNNKNIRTVINTITSKAVLILGRFTNERKAVLDALREELRKHDYLPILFDFDVPSDRDITETVSLLARMARFIIADLTDPSSIPKELEAIVPHLAVPVKPLLEGPSRPFVMFKDYWKYPWMLRPYKYKGLKQLLEKLPEKVIAPSERKVKALQAKRRKLEAMLTKPHR